MSNLQAGPEILTALASAIVDGRVRVVDLTHSLTPDFPVIAVPPQFKQAAPFRIQTVSRYDEHGARWYWNDFSMNEHTGTHFDAPAHWVTGKDVPDGTVDRIAPERFFGPAVTIDATSEIATDDAFILTRAWLERWEAAHGRIPDRHWILLRTDWSKRLGTPAYANIHDGRARRPGPDPGAMSFLVHERQCIGFGVETIGTDAGIGHTFDPPQPAHSILHGNGRLGLQCLANLDQLPLRGALIVAAPLKIGGGSGSPLRVLALVPHT